MTKHSDDELVWRIKQTGICTVTESDSRITLYGTADDYAAKVEQCLKHIVELSHSKNLGLDFIEVNFLRKHAEMIANGEFEM